ncbi:hypothetical protein CNBJ1890 [Cryptococcus deneoformans B-3501A]|uniref:Uncharacterized protein n=1 Tax=Cryptococcus deneoformans (strain JEC21 / ATCC MYA-565) TaxID=214684 RepID=Q5KAI4_CRYD1|nr:hypothetical protein CNJ01570 [Cryptococcus neoformans var. neoformans JEC21]XP_773194.1 hypothetical protein CNBJ1890 [Cryptococcus neoformans var. neoformans B-3501A]AAW45914.1 hypothetical protein CNJ01570 [Cryptococcus neoformans var. neoformans JEC21]EAL18547.1 hypothetical protein CNBJ1890 [Cryptococcus neoformans var. neoformans B-3501A]
MSVLTDHYNDYPSDSSTSSSGDMTLSSSSSSLSSPSTSVNFVPLSQAPDTIRMSQADGHWDCETRGRTPYASDSTTAPPSPLSTPRRIARRKKLVYDALECACLLASIANGEIIVRLEIERKDNAQKTGERLKKDKGEEDGSIQRPWERLVKSLRELQKEDPVETKIIERCSAVLNETVETQVRPLTDQKLFMQPLTGFESRAARSLKSKEPVNSLSMSLQNPSALANVPLFLLLRFARFALSPAKSKSYLDLSHLPYPDAKTFLEEMDIDWLMELVGCEAADVTHLDLSNNFLTQFPHWPAFPFPNVQVLRVTSNPLPSVPYSLIHLPNLRRIPHRHTLLAHPRSGQDCAYKTYFWGTGHPSLPKRVELDKKQVSALPKRERGVPSLVEFGMLMVARQRVEFTPSEDNQWLNEARYFMPVHLSERMENSFVCDRCHQLHIPPSLEMAEVTRKVGQRFGDKVWDAKWMTGWQLKKRHEDRSSTVWLEMVLCPLCLYHVLAVTSGR